MNSSILRNAAAAVGLAWFSPALHASVIFGDTFDAGTGAWYTGGTVGELTNSSQQLSWNITNTTTVNGMRQVIGRSFPKQSIAVGESIEFTFD